MDGQQIVTSVVKVTDQMIDYLRTTKMWTKFLSIMGFIAAAFMVLMGIFIMLASNLFPKEAETKIPAFMGIMYMLLSIVYIIPSVYLLKYSSALGRYLGNKSESEFESALSYQKSFWKFIGVVGIIGMIFMVVCIVAAIAIPLMLRH